jgi:hypothetical protein
VHLDDADRLPVLLDDPRAEVVGAPVRQRVEQVTVGVVGDEREGVEVAGPGLPELDQWPKVSR